MKLHNILFFLFIPYFVHGQKNSSPELYAKVITVSNLKKHLYSIAAPEMEGRETATRGELRAAAYISDHFKSIGLLPGNRGNYLMPFPAFFRDTLLDAGVEINGEVFKWNKDFSVDVNSHTSTMMFSEAVCLGSAEVRSALKINLTGRLVIVFDSLTFYYAYSKGPAALLLVQRNFSSSITIRKSTINSFRRSIPPLSFVISDDIANAITRNGYAQLQDSLATGTFKYANYKVDVKLGLNKQSDIKYANNVVGYIEGTDKKNEYLLITAHYDHLGIDADSVIRYGADDNASGTSALLAIAEAFTKAKAAGDTPRRTIVFMTVSGEEKGLWGSQYYADHALFFLEKTTANLNIDMVGRIDPGYEGDTANYIYAIGENRLSSDLQKITDEVNSKYSKLIIDRKFNESGNNYFFRSDQYNFAKNGIPVIFYFNGEHADYHRASDTPDKINYMLLEKRTRLIFHTAWEIANRDEMLKRDKPLN